MLSIRDSIYQFVYKIAGDKYFELVNIALSWSSIVGNIMAERSSIVKFDQSILYVKTVNHAWMQEFLLKKRDIIQAMKERNINQVKDIIFFV